MGLALKRTLGNCRLAWCIGAFALLASAVMLACGPADTPQTTGASPTAAPFPKTPAQPRGGTASPRAASPSPAAPTSPVFTRRPTPTPTPAPTGPNAAGVELDPEWRDNLSDAGVVRYGWKTEFAYHTVPYDEIRSGGPPRDGIPPIDTPRFVSPEEADEWLEAREPVVVLELNGDSRAYPLQILMWHEIVNDEVGGEPVTVTFCPLCNSAIAFDRNLNGVVYDFGTSGNLRHSDLVMWDRETESWWQQLTGEGIVGDLAGQRLRFLPASIVAWEDFKATSPGGLVLSRNTGHDRQYGSNPYVGYDKVDEPPFLYRGELDGRLLPKERVAAVSIGGVDLAFPFSVLREERVVNYPVADRRLAVFFKPGARSALDEARIGSSREIGAAAVFDAVLDGRELAFEFKDEAFRDTETGSTWNIRGQAVAGPLAGQRLEQIVHGDHFWFAWAAFRPDTITYSGSE